ncbi:HupE/UreJ family protein [Sphingomonas profundi]|uniref:HupE/UreJ family protein n=1 Tax=Alterirhizorhabdus profundi TaxID=2681549 RepID=UPI001E32D9A9|nr:HupE/UreJ family protein [Sphingomonas profundi]
MARILLALLALLAFAAPARADVFSLGRYDFGPGEEAGVYELTASVPETVASRLPVVWPEGCAETGHDRQTMAGRARYAFEIRCGRALGRDDVIRTPWLVDGAAFTSTIAGAPVEQAVTAGDDGAVLPVGAAGGAERSFRAVAADYGVQGILHILGGWDHLAFVLCLCLLTRGRQLLLLVTTFTAGHSISLALAFFDVIHVPVPPVEAVIALSIAFMAREALRVTPDAVESVAARRRYMAIVATFGLLHGLGFATALGELGVSPHERVEGLVFFNVGVEVGQLLFVGVVLAAMAAARAIGRAEPVRVAALYGAGALGCFWMLERVAGFGQLAA